MRAQTMGEIVNLNRARKERQRAEKERQAAINREQFGRTSMERARTREEKARADRALDGKKQDVPDPD
ncbi:MAG: DUF4169 family protein [Rhodospirillaceae bacterium]|nr:DUF4169 family protein [Rhodospirillaceae bacterium]MEA4839243.1 DUF4169 family protein [Rhodospirillaceae bacterium]